MKLLRLLLPLLLIPLNNIRADAEPTITGLFDFSLMSNVKVIVSGDAKFLEEVGKYLINKGAVSSETNIVNGPLTISDITVYLSPGGISLAGDGTLFGRPITLALESIFDTAGQKISKDKIIEFLKGINITFTLKAIFKEPISIELLGKKFALENVYISVSKDKSFKLSSTVTLFGQSMALGFKVKNDKSIDLEGEIKKPLLLKNLFPFIGPMGDFYFENISCIMINAYNPNRKPFEPAGPTAVTIKTSFKAPQTAHPFSNVSGLSQIGLKNFDFIFEQKKDTTQLQLQGEVTIFNQTLNGTLRFIQKGKPLQNESAKYNTVLEVNASAYAHISQLISGFKGTIFDDITLRDLKIIASSNDFEEEREVDKQKKKFKYKAGVSLVAKSELSGALSPLAKLGNQPQSVEVILSGHIASDPLKSSFKIELPFMIPIKGKDLSLGNIAVEIGGLPIPTLSILTTLEFKVPRQNEPLKFTARISVNPTDALIAGSLIGVWHNACGLNGFDLSNVALQLGVNYAALASGLPISNFGLAATLGLGRRNLSLATNISIAHPEDFVLTGSLDKLSVQDFAELINQVTHAHLDTNNIPDIAFEKLRFYMAPKDTKIGEFEFKQGFGGAAGISVIRFKAFVDFSYMKDEGIVFEGYASKFYLGELLVTGAGPDRIYGTADDGPYAKLELTKSAQRLFL
ncbi:MAG: hypothetical protein WA432_01350, partial [Candidatus Babeliaceae bacterium]